MDRPFAAPVRSTPDERGRNAGLGDGGFLGAGQRFRPGHRRGRGVLRAGSGPGRRLHHVVRQRRADLGIVIRADGGGVRPGRPRPERSRLSRWCRRQYPRNAWLAGAANIASVPATTAFRCASGQAIALGALLDGVPESVAIGSQHAWRRPGQHDRRRGDFPVQHPGRAVERFRHERRAARRLTSSACGRGLR